MKEARFQRENGSVFIFRADTVPELIRVIYASPDLEPLEMIILSDRVEARYGEREPGIFSWTEGIEPEPEEDDDEDS